MYVVVITEVCISGPQSTDVGGQFPHGTAWRWMTSSVLFFLSLSPSRPLLPFLIPLDGKPEPFCLIWPVISS